MRGPEQMIVFGDINGRIQRFEGLHGPRKHPRKVLKQYLAFIEEYRRMMTTDGGIIRGVNVEIQIFARYRFPSLQLWGPYIASNVSGPL